MLKEMKGNALSVFWLLVSVAVVMLCIFLPPLLVMVAAHIVFLTPISIVSYSLSAISVLIVWSGINKYGYGR